MTNKSGAGRDDISWWSQAPTRQRVIAAAVGVCVGLVVVAIGICAAVTVGLMLLDSSAAPYPLSGPPIDAAFVWYGFVPLCSLTGVAVGVAAGLAATRLRVWLAQESTR